MATHVVRTHRHRLTRRVSRFPVGRHLTNGQSARRHYWECHTLCPGISVTIDRVCIARNTVRLRTRAPGVLILREEVRGNETYTTRVVPDANPYGLYFYRKVNEVYYIGHLKVTVVDFGRSHVTLDVNGAKRTIRRRA